MKSKRLLAVLLLALFSLPFLFSAWNTVQVLTRPRPTPDVIFSPYVQEGQYEKIQRGGQQVDIPGDSIRNIESGVRASFYPYSHYNVCCTLPMTVEETVGYQIRRVNYEFQFSENRLQISSIEFYVDEHWRRLFEENGKIYEQRTDSSWPFNGKTEICDLSPEVGFYDPIDISGLGGCGVILLSSEDPGVMTEIRVYVPTSKGWAQAQFLLPDGSRAECIEGYVRRWEDYSARGSANKMVGKMELCLKNGDTGLYELHQVTYSEGVLALAPDNSVEITDDSLLHWNY